MPPSSIRGLIPRRPCCAPSTTTHPHSPHTSSPTLLQVRHATYIRRPRRPYQFTQLIHLSDGSTFTVRTTSPQPVYKSVHDTRNHILWQPSEKSLQNIEHDEAGKLAAFRDRFGRGFDLRRTEAEIEADRERKRVRDLELDVQRRQRAAVLAKDSGISEDEALERVLREEQADEVVEEDTTEIQVDMGLDMGLDMDVDMGAAEDSDEGFDALADLISGYAKVEAPKKETAAPAPAPVAEAAPAKGKGKGKKK